MSHPPVAGTAAQCSLDPPPPRGTIFLAQRFARHLGHHGLYLVKTILLDTVRPSTSKRHRYTP